ncbi:ribonuclease H-like domain-containing protein [Tanacetum coccineum]
MIGVNTCSGQLQFSQLTGLPGCLSAVVCCFLDGLIVVSVFLLYLYSVMCMEYDLSNPHGVNDVYQPIRSSILSRENLPEVKDAFAIISREESHRGIASTSSGSLAKPQISGFVSSTNNWSNNGNKKNNNKKFSHNNPNYRGPNPNLKCTNCEKTGHTADRCFDLIGYPPGYNRNPAPRPNNFRPYSANNASPLENGAPLSFTNEQMMKLMNLINDVPSGSNTGNIQANLAGRCTYMNSNVLFNLNFKTFFNTNTILCKASLRWIIDSGANQHMTISTINMFGIVDVSDLSLTVGHPNGTLAKVKFVGNLKLNSHVTLYDVLVVPEYCVSLLSVNKLLKDSKLFVGFTESKCYIQDLVHSQIVGTGSENGGLYLFDYDSPKSSMCSNIGNMSAVCYVSKSLWHSRLGHPSDQALDVLQGNLRFTKNSSKSPCDICHKAKQTREPFPLSEHKTTNIGDLIKL